MSNTKKVSSFALTVTMMALLASCNGSGGSGEGVESGSPTKNIDTSQVGNNTSPTVPIPGSAEIGTSCDTSGDNICLGLKYVVYNNPTTGKPVVDADQAVENVAVINSIWAQCKISFQIDKFAAVNPADYGLTYNTQVFSELTTARSKFVDDSTLLVVTTGVWGSGISANAWTAMPGGGPYGVVLEGASGVGDFGNIIAHELGHYLNLDHISDTSNVMDAIIYSYSDGLTTSQCTEARKIATQYWSKMLR